jgi:hypothetical protein
VAEMLATGQALCKIDWYSFTAEISHVVGNVEADTLDAVNAVLGPIIRGWLDPISVGQAWEFEKGRGFYTVVAMHTDTKLRVSWGDVNTNIYVELSGQTCDACRAVGRLENLIDATALRASRIDFAVDLHCDDKPGEFIVKRQNVAFKSCGEIHSEDGDTSYVGSRKGERLARVYRYHDPHPRAAFLRVEAEYHKKAARSAAAAVTELGEVAACMAGHAVFGWQAPAWAESLPVVSKLRSSPVDRPQRGELRWLSRAVRPALLRLAREGSLDLHSWCDRLLDEYNGQ